ncbi:DUF4405 domain-containing protein [Pseudodesulfovibrio sp. JC047]|uniref:DUF4405 domain-containing protein n=1 Tax=Pseudodesulfovibrio sp. JC047 TaxID=2683199 RepID=UPI0013D3C766|nr:DUF4405 domain-containing protein [Pseudodesulfovibrio sp. JC047]NDV18856.1 DUF4405 domain-containing protein [Pseudodesulfovibrio sp. JC047]
MVRKIVSLTGLLSFLVTLLTSVILYIVPEGRVAYWADWHLIGLTKHQWGDIHVTIGALFLVSMVVHIWLNWKPLMSAMKNRARELVVLTGPMFVSLLLTLFVLVGTLLGLPPMQQILDWSAEIKEEATVIYGNPPYGHAETSPLMKFCGFLGLDAHQAVKTLHAAGYDPTLNEYSVIKDIARSKGVSPQQVYDTIRQGQVVDPYASMPDLPPVGTGKFTIATVCATYGLDVHDVLAKLKAAGMDATPESSFKALAAKHGGSPKDIYLSIKGR